MPTLRLNEGVIVGPSGTEECRGCVPVEVVELCVWVPGVAENQRVFFNFKPGHEVVPLKKQ